MAKTEFQRTIVRLVVSPLVLGLTAFLALEAFWKVIPFLEPSFERPGFLFEYGWLLQLIALAVLALGLGYGTTQALIRIEGGAAHGLRGHFRQTWLLYVLGLYFASSLVGCTINTCDFFTSMLTPPIAAFCSVAGNALAMMRRHTLLEAPAG